MATLITLFSSVTQVYMYIDGISTLTKILLQSACHASRLVMAIPVGRFIVS